MPEGKEEQKTALPPEGVFFKNYVREYMAIVRFLFKKGCAVKGQKFLLIRKEELYKLLDKNAYETAEKKLKNWRGMKWIEAEPGRLTHRVSINGRTCYMVKIDTSIYKAMLEIG